MDRAAIIDDVEKTLAQNLPGVEVVDVEAAGSRGSPVLRVFIDHPDGVSHELCVRVTGLLDRYLQDYAVEVSSPGLERRLRKPEHFAGAVGKNIIIKTFRPVDGQRNFTGFLLSADGQSLRLKLEDRELALPLEEVASARLVFDFGEKEKPRRERKKRGRQR